jgi:hypothetical protein
VGRVRRRSSPGDEGVIFAGLATIAPTIAKPSSAAAAGLSQERLL